MPRLYLFAHGLTSHVPLRPGRTWLGRSDRCDVALPGEQVSRRHAYIDAVADGWRLTSRGASGTRLNGAAVEGPALLRDGDELEIGEHRAVFRLEADPASNQTTQLAEARTYEDPVEISEHRFAACRAVVKITRGPYTGREVELEQARVKVGGKGADLLLGPDLPANAAALRVARGRVIVESGLVPAYVASARVREPCPVFPGEEVRVGEYGFVYQMQTRVHPSSPDYESLGDMVGRSKPMRQVFALLKRVAAHDAPVLLLGESGCGKELAARAVHDLGTRQDGPFVALNCAAIADTLFESELFGHEKGAFTGASSRQDGAFQRAAGGTLFLDEVGELQHDLQAKLLRALESGDVRRVGGSQPEYPDVRVVAATNRNLRRMVRDGSFREDLFYRLAVLAVRLPPLRERPEDIELLARTLLAKHHPGARLAADALPTLAGYAWPGNVRELRNVLARAVVVGGPVVTAESLSFDPLAFDDDGWGDAFPSADQGHSERTRLARALAEAEGNRTRAARLLGIPRSSLLYKLKRHGVG